jgi:MoxR-like ATPase
MTAMTIATAALCLRECVEADIPAFLWGAPGIGKSQAIDQVAASLDMPVIDWRANLRDPVDVRGLPVTDIKAGVTKWLCPAELPVNGRHGPRGILKMDELNTASPAMMAVCFQIVLERRAGEHKLDDGWVPVAAGNRMSDRAAVQRMPTALRNRFAHFEVQPDVETWAKWAAAAGIAPVVIGFNRFRPELHHKMPDQKDETHAFPTPRAWEKVSRVATKPREVRLHLVAGLVGDAAAGEFEAFVRIYDAVYRLIDEVLASPSTAKVPTDPAELYAVSSAIARLSDRKTFASVLKYAQRLPKEFEIVTAVDAVKRDPGLAKTSAFGQWAVSNQDVII